MTIIYPDLTALSLRMGFGFFMAFGHGLKKAQHLFSGDEIQFVSMMGLSETICLALTVFAEFVCSIMIMIGYKTRLFCIPLIITMVIAAFYVHGGDPMFMQSADGGSKEPALLYMTGFLCIYFLGSGKYSVDDRIDSAL